MVVSAVTGSSAFLRNEAADLERRRAQIDQLAEERDRWRARNSAYYRSIEQLARFVVPAGASVLEFGCGTGDLLAALQPKDGVGIDLSPRMVERAQRKHPHLTFLV